MATYTIDKVEYGGNIYNLQDSNALTSHQTIKQDGITGATVNRYGVCSTAANTAAKTVSITTGTFSLETGARITVRFDNENIANSPTLNVNSTGAKEIFHQFAKITGGNNKALLAGIVDFVYDGTRWHLVGNYINNESNGIVVSATQPVDQKIGDLWFVLTEDAYPTAAESETF